MTTASAVPPLTVSPHAPGASRDQARRALTLLLALIWLLDAALQYQPYMFTRAFPNDVITPVGTGSPGWVNSPDQWTGHFMAHHIVFWNAVFATVQLALAIGLMLRRSTRITLAVSVVWSVMVWWLGEGLGGVLAGAASPVTGLPGAVVIYALIAVLLWPPATDGRSAESSRDSAGSEKLSVAETSAVSAVGARLIWIVFWAAFVFETLRPADRAHRALSGMISGMADGEPTWLASINRWAAHALVGNGLAASVVLAIVFAALGVSVLVPIDRRPILIIGIIVALAIWLIAEDLGEIATGEATDPNSGPLLVLLALCYWPLGRARNALTRS